MRPLFVLILILSCSSFTNATPFRFEPRLELPPGTSEYNTASCVEQVADMGILGRVIAIIAKASPQTACFLNKPASGDGVSRHFESRLTGLGYRKETENDQAPYVYSSKWASSSDSVLSFIWLEYSPSEVLTLVLYNDGSATREQAGGAVADALTLLMEEANHPDEPVHLKQETRFPLPSGALELPVDWCEPGLARATFIEFPLLGCYAVPLKPTKLLAKLDSQLTPLGYEQSYLAEESAFTAVNWVNPKPGAPKLSIIIASAKKLGGSLLHEIDIEAAEKSFNEP